MFDNWQEYVEQFIKVIPLTQTDDFPEFTSGALREWVCAQQTA